MADLRQRLLDARLVSENDGRPWLGADDEAGADAALAVFAEWLRERAGAAGMQYRAEAELRRLADQLDPPKGDQP